ncbi:MAG: benzoate/H(+) symporter BenE family transporter, partial [Limnohabitans sp.]
MAVHSGGEMLAGARMTSLWRDFSVSTLVAGFVAVLVGFTSSAAIVFSAAQALGATPAQTV